MVKITFWAFNGVVMWKIFHWKVKLVNVSRQNILPPAAATAARSLQSSPTLCDPIDGSPPDPHLKTVTFTLFFSLWQNRLLWLFYFSELVCWWWMCAYVFCTKMLVIDFFFPVLYVWVCTPIIHQNRHLENELSTPTTFLNHRVSCLLIKITVFLTKCKCGFSI